MGGEFKPLIFKFMSETFAENESVVQKSGRYRTEWVAISLKIAEHFLGFLKSHGFKLENLSRNLKGYWKDMNIFELVDFLRELAMQIDRDFKDFKDYRGSNLGNKLGI